MDEDEKKLLNAAIGAVIRGERTKRSMTRQDLADQSGIKYETLKSIETGKYKISTIDMTQAATALGMSAVQLVEDVMKFYEELRVEAGLPRSTNPRTDR